MTQTKTQPEREPAADEALADLDRLLARDMIPAEYRHAPLRSEDRLLEFMDKPGILSTIANAFPDPALTEGQRAAKARKLVEEARILLANADKKVREPLLRCTTDSFVQAISNCASLDLSLCKPLGQACLVPYQPMATLMVQYQGFITIIMRTGVVVSIQAEAVYKGELDSLVIENGKPIAHRKRLDCDRSDAAIVGVYAEARCAAGPPVNVMLNRAEIDTIKKTSKAQEGPWKWWYGEMAKKSAVRRLHKQLAQGGDPAAQAALARAIELDNRDFGLAAKQAEDGLREFGRGIRQRAKAATIVDAKADPPAPEKAAGSAWDPGATVDKQWIARFMLAVKAARHGESDMADESWAEAVAGGPLTGLTKGRMAELGGEVTAGKFDPATGERLPEATGDEPAGDEAGG